MKSVPLERCPVSQEWKNTLYYCIWTNKSSSNKANFRVSLLATVNQYVFEITALALWSFLSCCLKSCMICLWSQQLLWNRSQPTTGISSHMNKHPRASCDNNYYSHIHTSTSATVSQDANNYSEIESMSAAQGRYDTTELKKCSRMLGVRNNLVSEHYSPLQLEKHTIPLITPLIRLNITNINMTWAVTPISAHLIYITNPLATRNCPRMILMIYVISLIPQSQTILILTCNPPSEIIRWPLSLECTLNFSE